MTVSPLPPSFLCQALPFAAHHGDAVVRRARAGSAGPMPMVEFPSRCSPALLRCLGRALLLFLSFPMAVAALFGPCSREFSPARKRIPCAKNSRSRAGLSAPLDQLRRLRGSLVPSWPGAIATGAFAPKHWSTK
jgi:hypothetical protein